MKSRAVDPREDSSPIKEGKCFASPTPVLLFFFPLAEKLHDLLIKGF